MAGFCLIPYPKTFLTSLYLNVFYNALVIICGAALPHAAMGILMKKDLFEKLHGFDESIKLAEDHDLARRAKKFGKFGIISSPAILFSDRRFKKEGWLTLGFKYFLGELHIMFIGPVRSDIFKYKFNHYDKEKK